MEGSPHGTSTTQLLHLRVRGHGGKGDRMIASQGTREVVCCEVMPSYYDKKAIFMIIQQYGCLNET